MKIKQSRKIKDKISEYFEIMDFNDFMINVLIDPINSDEIIFDNYKENKEAALDTLEIFQKTNYIMSYDEALLLNMIAAIVNEEIDLADFPENVMVEMLSHGKVFHRGNIEYNPYFKNIKLEEKKYGNLNLCKTFFHKYELFSYGILNVNGILIPQIGTFDYRFSYPCLIKDNAASSVLSPYEMFAMQDFIDKASGKVLIFGVELGYSAYMVSEKESVKNITIVEPDSDKINLFVNEILPQFPNKEKIEIIQSDVNYLKQVDDNKFDFCFINSDDILDFDFYVKVKQLCKKFHSMDISYFMEDTVINMIMPFVFLIILNEYDKDEAELPEDDGHVYEYLENLLKDKEINIPSDVDFYMNYKNIMDLI